MYVFYLMYCFIAMMMYFISAANINDIRSVGIDFSPSEDTDGYPDASHSEYKSYDLQIVNGKLSGNIKGLPQGEIFVYLVANDEAKNPLFTSNAGDSIYINPGQSTNVAISLLAVDISDNDQNVLDEKEPIILSINVQPAVIVSGEKVVIDIKVKDFEPQSNLMYDILDQSIEQLSGSVSEAQCVDDVDIGDATYATCTLTYDAVDSDTEGLKTIDFTTYDKGSDLSTNADIEFSIKTRGSAGINLGFDNAPIIQDFGRDLDYVSDLAYMYDATQRDQDIEIDIHVTDDISLSYVDLEIVSAEVDGFEDTHSACNHTYSSAIAVTEDVREIDELHTFTPLTEANADMDIYTICRATLRTKDKASIDKTQGQLVESSFVFFITNRNNLFNKPYVVSSHQTSLVTSLESRYVDFELVASDHVSTELLSTVCRVNGFVQDVVDEVVGSDVKYTFTGEINPDTLNVPVVCEVTGSGGVFTFEFSDINKGVALITQTQPTTIGGDFVFVVNDPTQSTLSVVCDNGATPTTELITSSTLKKITLSTVASFDVTCTVTDGNDREIEVVFKDPAGRRLLMSESKSNDFTFTLSMNVDSNGVVLIESNELIDMSVVTDPTPTTEPKVEDTLTTGSMGMGMVIGFAGIAVVAVGALLVVVSKKRSRVVDAASIENVV